MPLLCQPAPAVLEVSVIMALLALCSSPSLYDTFIYFPTFFYLYIPPSLHYISFLSLCCGVILYNLSILSSLSFSPSFSFCSEDVVPEELGHAPTASTVWAGRRSLPPHHHHHHSPHTPPLPPPYPPPPLTHIHTHTPPAPVTNKPLGLTYSTSVEAAGVSVVK